MLSVSLVFRNTYTTVLALKFIRCELISLHAETWTQFIYFECSPSATVPKAGPQCGSDAWISSSLSFPRLWRHESIFFVVVVVRVDVQVFSWVKMMVKELGRELGSAGLSWRNYAPEHQSEQHQRCGWEKPHTPRVSWDISFSGKNAQWDSGASMETWG